MAGSLIDKITVTFDAVDGGIFSSTCLLTLQLPRKFESYELFKAVWRQLLAMLLALLSMLFDKVVNEEAK